MGTHHQSHPPDFESYSDSHPDTDTDPYPDPAMEMKTEQLSAVYVIFKCWPNVPYAGHILFLFLFLTSATPGFEPRTPVSLADHLSPTPRLDFL
ncbi:hypothetical protein ACLKA7_009152 [Drosophila subpalustris]